MSDFSPKYLKREQIESLYKQALEQAEGAAANAWLNLVINDDPIHRAVFEKAMAAVERLEKDRDRVLSPAKPEEPKA